MPESKKSHRAALSLMSRARFERGLSMERQIAAHVRELVRSGHLEEGARVPPIRALAEAWGTNYFTVQNALRTLVGEGLLVQSPRLGTFVERRRAELQRVCLYHPEDLRFLGASEFAGRLHVMVYQMLAARGVQTVSYFDHRPARDSAPEEILRLVRDRQADAVVATAPHADWLSDLTVPVASLQLRPERGGVLWNVREFARLAVEEAVAAGARTIGVIGRRSLAAGRNGDGDVDDMQTATETRAVAAGLKVVKLPDPPTPERNIEESGFLLGELIATMPNRPDALAVFPDTTTRGLVSAFLKHDVDVPDDLLLISHRNREMPFFTPFPVTWLTVKIEDYAQTLLAQIDTQIAGGKAGRGCVNVTKEPAAPAG